MASRVRRPRLRVLVVDDDLETRTSLCSVLSGLHCLGIPAASGEEVRKIIRRRRVDVVLLDLIMPAFDGADALREIRHLAADRPVIMMGTLMTPTLARRLRDRGAQGFLIKPVQRQQLAVALLPHLRGDQG